MNDIIKEAVSSFEKVADDLKEIRVVDHDKDILYRVAKIYGAMSICIDVLRGLCGEDYISEECNMPVQTMIKKIEQYTKEQNYDNSLEAQSERYISLYDHLYCKMYNIVNTLKNK